MSSTQANLFNNWNWRKKDTVNRVNYNCRGEKNSKHYLDFKNVCRMTQIELKEYLADTLLNYYETVYADDGFVYVKGTNSMVLLTAHMDTVHEPAGRICTDIYEYYDKKNKRHILSSPQGIGGDDRCGIYSILRILETTDIRPSIIFCEDEEIGGVGSTKFNKTELIDEVAKYNSFMIEIDRANANDAVFYEEENEEFQKYVMDITGTKEAYGSFSDICNLSEESNVSSFNISCGYYNAHTTDEYVVMEELEECIKKVIKLLKANQEDNKNFKYEPHIYYWNTREFNHSYGYGYGYGFYEDNYNQRNKTKEIEMGVEFMFYRDKVECTDVTIGKSFEECVGEFLMQNPDISWDMVYDYDEIW